MSEKLLNKKYCSLIEKDTNLIKITDDLLLDTKTDILKVNTIKLPIVELSSLGIGMSSLLPQLRTITETFSMDGTGLYRLANQAVGDALKEAKNGNFYGAYKTINGGSKFIQLKPVKELTTTVKTIAPINPANMMIAVTIASIEKQLSNIEANTKEIITFLEVERDSKIEAEIEHLSSIMSNYKSSWNNENFINSNHNLVENIKLDNRTKMIAFQKEITTIINEKNKIRIQSDINTIYEKLLKKFRYYRLSLYSFSLASLLEIILSGNFSSEHIQMCINEVEDNSSKYRLSFTKASEKLELINNKSLKMNFLKGAGKITKTTGDIVGNIPFIKGDSIKRFFVSSSDEFNKDAKEIKSKMIKEFAKVHNPKTEHIKKQMESIELIFNDTTDICFDNENIYLVTNDLK